MKIKRLVFNPFRENTYLVWDDTNEAIIVDAGNMNEGENGVLAAEIEALGLKPVMAVNTHGHFDHTQGAQSSQLYKYAAVLRCEYLDDGIYMLATSDKKAQGMFADHLCEKPEGIDD